MIIKLTESKLFTIEPAVRFGDEYKVSPKIWYDLWRRFNELEYTIPELCEFYYIKVGTPIKRRKMEDWIFKAQAYDIARSKMKLGAKVVNSEIFGDLEQRLVNELFKHVKSGDTKNVRVLA